MLKQIALPVMSNLQLAPKTYNSGPKQTISVELFTALLLNLRSVTVKPNDAYPSRLH